MKTTNKKSIKKSNTKQKNWPIVAAIVAGFAVIGTYLILQAGAAPKSQAAVALSLSPASQRVKVGQNLDVDIKVNTNGQAVNAVQASLSYPADKLEFVSVDNSGSAFDVTAFTSGGDGSVTIARGASTAVNSISAQIATVQFRTLASTRKATVSFKTTSAVIRASDNINILTKMISGQYTIQ